MVRTKWFMALVLLVAIPAMIFAQEDPEQANMRIDEVLGMEVQNAEGDLQGTIEDLVISMEGDIAFLGVQFEEAEGIEADQVYLVGADQASYEEQQLTLQVTIDDVAGLDTLEDGELPQEMAQDHVLASQLQEFALVDPQNEELGQLEGAMANLQEWRIEYLAIAPAGELGLQEQFYAVPADVIQEINVEESQIVLDVTGEEMEQYTGFSQDEWPQQIEELQQ